MNLRLRNISSKLKQENIDGLILTSPANISYLTKSNSRDSYLLISNKKNVYITDSRYTEEAKRTFKKALLIKKIDKPVFKVISDICLELGLKRLGFEEKHLACAEFKKLTKTLDKAVNLIPTNNLVEEARQIKSNEEIELIKKAIKITIMALEFIKDFISVGRTEIEIAAELERFIRYNGASRSAFDIIVASGQNSSFPHHLTSQKKIKNNEPVLIDIGVDYLGYKSDLTRVFFLGKINPYLKRIYDIVVEAQNRAIKKIKPGVNISSIDAAARQYIAHQGFGSYFGHNLGHGVGIEVHEKPYISDKENGVLVPGMVLTVEPAIYLPNRFGIRVEDEILVTQKRCEVLSGALNK